VNTSLFPPFSSLPLFLSTFSSPRSDPFTSAAALYAHAAGLGRHGRKRLLRERVYNVAPKCKYRSISVKRNLKTEADVFISEFCVVFFKNNFISGVATPKTHPGLVRNMLVFS